MKVLAFLWLLAGIARASPVAKTVTANGVKIHVLVEGSGPAVVLLHGFGETSEMWRPAFAVLAKTHMVIAPDLRGTGGSDKPRDGYDKKTLATDIHAVVRQLGVEHAHVVGHDIGLMVAYAYAAMFPRETDTLTLMDAVLPGIGEWPAIFNDPDHWHFHFFGKTPEALVTGHERTYLEHFWNDMAASPKGMPDAERDEIVRAYALPGAVHGAMEYFHNFERDAKDFAQLAQTPLAMPVMVLSGGETLNPWLLAQVRLVARDVIAFGIPHAGHWLIEENPTDTVRRIAAFTSSERRVRMPAAEIAKLAHEGAGTGTSGIRGVDTLAVRGNADLAGPYTIEIHVAPHTRIPPHTHPDERAATVVSGTWYFGYGAVFDEKALAKLPPGSFYTEPAGVAHFAMTGDEPVVVQLSGDGPSGMALSR